jgi:hypothetical protein
MMNRPAKNSSVSQFHAGHEVARLTARQQHQNAGAEQRHHRRLDVEGRVTDEPDEHCYQHDPTDDQ